MISMNSNQTAMGYEWNEFQIDTNITNQKRLMLRRFFDGTCIGFTDRFGASKQLCLNQANNHA